MKVLSLCFLLILSQGVMARRSLPAKIKMQIIAVLEGHEELHRAFFTYDKKKINSAAESLRMLARKVGVAPLKRPMILLVKDLVVLKDAKSREENNEAYHKVSLKLVDIIKKYDVGAHYNIYSCPMVKKKWVQNSSKRKRVHNPYAPEMPHCGQRDTDY